MVRYIDLVSDTICSPITAQGHAGVSVIRVSGENALKLTSLITKKNKWTTHLSRLANLYNSYGETVDQALVTYFEKTKSFTGDETVEIACHGNPLIVNKIIDLYISLGCRLAEKGEYSFRAFYNGRIDLVQAESIQSLIMSKNQSGSKTFLQQLDGSLSDQLNQLQNKLVLALSHLEASIDFSEEEIETKDLNEVSQIIQDVFVKCESLVKTFDVGKSLHLAKKVLILGKTNVGKSTLFNKILNKDRAIVSDIAGTTRDLVTALQFIENIEFEFIDSAGLRESSDPIEQMGIQKGLEQIKEADLVLYVFDSMADQFESLDFLPSDRTFFIFNKIDLLNNDDHKTNLLKQLKNLVSGFKQQTPFFISTLSGLGIHDLMESIHLFFNHDHLSSESQIVTQSRHFNHLKNIMSHLLESQNLLKEQMSPDLISQELSMALAELLQILGKEYNDEVLDKIFQEFCLGK